MSAAAWQPALPYELVEATDHHGPYVCTSYGSTVCDFYAMSDPSSLSVRNGGASRPVAFTDAAEHAAFMVKAANAHGELLDAIKGLVGDLEARAVKGVVNCSESVYFRARAAIAKAEGRS